MTVPTIACDTPTVPQAPAKTDEFELTVTFDAGKGKKPYLGKVAGSLGFCVLKVDAGKSLGKNQFARTTAKAGAKYVRIYAFVKNYGRTSLLITEDLFRLLYNDAEYSASAAALMALETDGHTTLSFLQLNPGLSESAYIVFEVPESIDMQKAVIRFSDSLLFGKTRMVPALALPKTE